MQSGVGIRIGANFANQVATATIRDVTIDDYQKGGIVIDGVIGGPSSQATVTGSTITGAGMTPLIAQNGVQVSRGANATITDNTIRDNYYTGPDTGTGILFYLSDPAGSTVSGNNFSGNQYDIIDATTTTKLDSSANPTSVGDAVTFTATVAQRTPSTPLSPTPLPGLVQFVVDGAAVGSPQSLDANNQAHLTIATLAAGTHTVEADYSGSNLLEANPSSASIAQVVSSGAIANDGFYGVHENLPVNVPAWIGLLSDDIYDPSQPVTAQLVSGPADGSLSLNGDGSFAYTPNTGFVGTDSFTYDDLQGSLTGNVATVTLNVHAQNQPPVAQKDSYMVIMGQSLTVSADQGVLSDDYDPEDDPITAQLVSGPQHGALQLNSDGSFTYTPSAGFLGTDRFTYRDFDGLAYGRTATVVIDVQHAINLFPPDDQANNEGEAVNLQFPATDANGRAITWTATGLPPDVGIDPNTGVFTGTVSYTAAQTNHGIYPVTLTVTDGQDTVSSNFTWYVTDTNRLTQPDDQVNEPGDVVSLQLQATGGPFTFAAAGLPAGLGINPSTGLISGTITENPNQPRTHTVTVSITGGGTTDSQQFNWTVQNNQPYVDIAINDTESTDDDFTANLQPIPALVTLHDPVPGEHKVQIVVPSGLSTISGGSLLLADGQSAEIAIVPQQYSQKEDDVVLLALDDGKQAGEAKATNAKITVTQEITNPDTPAAMTAKKIYRIPPRVFTTIQVTVTPTLKGKTLTAEVLGQSDLNGRTVFATKGGGESTAVSWTTGEGGPLYIKGVAGKQTEPGNAGQLKVAIVTNTRPAPNEALSKLWASSLGFSVAAIPLNYTDKFLSDITQGRFRGIKVQDGWQSDSGQIEDLNKVGLSEQVQNVELEGSFKTGTGTTSNNVFLPATIFTEDSHRAGVAKFRENGGKQVSVQVNIFNDDRTGARNVPMQNSGYRITKTIFKDPTDGKWKITVEKVGAKVTAQGFQSDAGATEPAAGIKKTVGL